jgi:hypothetical protein
MPIGQLLTRSAAHHQREPEDDRALVAKMPAEEAARIGDGDPREKIEADEEAELRVIDAELADQEWRQRGDSLELESHRGPRQKQDRQDEPPVARHTAFATRSSLNNAA